MRRIIHSGGFKLWASADDTYSWAHRAGAAWPCSTLSGRRVFAEFDDNGVLDFAINGGRGEQDADGHEFAAMVSDMMRGHVPADNPAACYLS